jgi:hypothetical protein
MVGVVGPGRSLPATESWRGSWSYTGRTKPRSGQ